MSTILKSQILPLRDITILHEPQIEDRIINVIVVILITLLWIGMDFELLTIPILI